MEIEKEAKLAISAVQLAGEKVLSLYLDEKEYIHGDPEHTLADVESHKILFEALSDSEYPIISEEGEIPQNITSESCWIVDPLDGTRDFVSRTGDFCVMVGFMRHQKPVFGAIYSPCTQELYFGCVLEDSKQAYRKQGNSKFPLNVSTDNSIKSLRPILSRSRFNESDRTILKMLGSPKPTLMGSIGLKFAAISNKSSEVYWNLEGLSIWDICAPYALLCASGGNVTDIFGASLDFSKLRLTRGILASNGVVHKNLVSEISKIW